MTTVGPPPAMMTTIRTLNGGTIPSGTRVQVQGVVESPGAIGYAVDYDQSCLYELDVVMADPNPTLQDGIAVRTIVRGVASADMMVKDSDCQALGAQQMIGKAPRDSAVTIEGTLLIENGIHSIDVTPAFSQVTSMGKSTTLPTPVTVTASQLPSLPLGSTPPAMQFVGAYSAYVSIQNGGQFEVVSENHAPTLTFKVSPTAADVNKTRIATDWIRLGNSAYTPPPDATQYHSVNGIVSTDLGGIVRPRDASDIQ
jgi:hypothetical protein